jgi:hypothetical protein
MLRKPRRWALRHPILAALSAPAQGQDLSDAAQHRKYRVRVRLSRSAKEYPGRPADRSACGGGDQFCSPRVVYCRMDDGATAAPRGVDRAKRKKQPKTVNTPTFTLST